MKKAFDVISSPWLVAVGVCLCVCAMCAREEVAQILGGISLLTLYCVVMWANAHKRKESASDAK